MKNAMSVMFRMLIIGLLAALPATLAAAPLGTDFSYQGRLTQSGNPAAGSFDFQFKLYDALTGGAQVGSTLTRAGVAVTTGLFTISLDFGAVIDGRALFLETAVRPAGSGSYTTLAPRQPLTAAPYALYSSGAPWSGLKNVPAGFADGVDHNTTYTAGAGLILGGQTFNARFGGTGATQTIARADHNHNTTYNTTTSLATAGQARVDWGNLTSVPGGFGDGIDNDTQYAPGMGLELVAGVFNVQFGGTGWANTAAHSDHTQDWSTLTQVPAGLADGDDDTQYTAGAGLDLTKNIFSVLFEGSGKLDTAARSDHTQDWATLTQVPAGLADGDDDTQYTAGTGLSLAGTTFSNAHVAGAGLSLFNNKFDVFFAGSGAADSVSRSDHTQAWGTLTGVPAGFADGTDNDTLYTGGTGITVSGMNINNRHVAGTGLTLTGDTFNNAHVPGAGLNLTGNIFSVLFGGPGVANTASRSDHHTWASLTGIPAGFADGTDNDTLYTAGTGLSLIGGVFNVLYSGDGAANAAARSDHGHFGDSWMNSDTNYGLSVQNTGTAGDGIRAYSVSNSGTNSGVYGSGSNNAEGVVGLAANGSGVHGISTNGNGVFAESTSSHGIRVIGGGDGSSMDGVGDIFLGGNIGEILANSALDLQSNMNVVAQVDYDNNNSGGFYVANGTNSTKFYVLAAGDARVFGPLRVDGYLTAAGGKSGYVVDIAQNDGAEALELGDVVAISGAGPALIGEIPLVKVRKATAENAEGIVGVVDKHYIPPTPDAPAASAASPAAGDPQAGAPAEPEQQTEYTEEAVPPGGYLSMVTLGSYKAIKVDATYGPIKPGCLLTASPNPGYAMRAVSPATGTVIGKALAALDSGTGTIPVMVTVK